MASTWADVNSWLGCRAVVLRLEENCVSAFALPKNGQRVLLVENGTEE